MSDWSRNMSDAAAAKGLVVVTPKPNELFIDIDDASSLQAFHVAIGVFGDLVTGHEQRPSPSGRDDRFHIRVTLSRDVTDDFERIALQAMLGSDRLHEALSWKAAERGERGVTVFFEKPKDASPSLDEAPSQDVPVAELPW